MKSEPCYGHSTVCGGEARAQVALVVPPSISFPVLTYRHERALQLKEWVQVPLQACCTFSLWNAWQSGSVPEYSRCYSVAGTLTRSQTRSLAWSCESFIRDVPLHRKPQDRPRTSGGDHIVLFGTFGNPNWGVCGQKYLRWPSQHYQVPYQKNAKERKKSTVEW